MATTPSSAGGGYPAPGGGCASRGARGAGLMFAIGLLTPLAAAGIVGIMSVAGIVVHRKNGFFITKEGYEYVAYISLVCAAIGAMGPGRWSIDHPIGFKVTGWH